MNPLIRSGEVLSARLVSGELHVVSKTGKEERWVTKQLSSGGNNTVLELVAQSLVARFSTEPMGADEQRKYVDEVEVQTALGGLSLSPEPLCILHFVEGHECSFKSEPYTHRSVRMGIVMRKYDMALDAVLRSPKSTAEVFIASDGESRIVELFARASSHATCVDTKCANVMFALSPLDVVLIDLDVKFCGTRKRTITAGYTLAAVEAALREFHSGDRTDSTYALCACAVSLLILCMDISKSGAMTVMTETTAMLLRNIHIVIRILAEDDAAVIFEAGKPNLMWMGASFSALSQIRYYTSLRAAGYIPFILRKALESRQTRLFLTCRASRDTATYVSSVRAMSQAQRAKRPNRR
jgi:hypothetical protein